MQAHSFHIPVMGLGFTADTPLKVSQYGIDSAISLVDDVILDQNLRTAFVGIHSRTVGHMGVAVDVVHVVVALRRTRRNAQRVDASGTALWTIDGVLNASHQLIRQAIFQSL